MNEEQSEQLAHAILAIANAITPRAACASEDATGGVIESVTEALMGHTAGLVRIAEAIDNLAEAVREELSDAVESNHE